MTVEEGAPPLVGFSDFCKPNSFFLSCRMKYVRMADATAKQTTKITRNVTSVVTDLFLKQLSCAESTMDG